MTALKLPTNRCATDQPESRWFSRSQKTSALTTSLVVLTWAPRPAGALLTDFFIEGMHDRRYIGLNTGLNIIRIGGSNRTGPNNLVFSDVIQGRFRSVFVVMIDARCAVSAVPARAEMRTEIPKPGDRKIARSILGFSFHLNRAHNERCVSAEFLRRLLDTR